MKNHRWACEALQKTSPPRITSASETQRFCRRGGRISNLQHIHPGHPHMGHTGHGDDRALRLTHLQICNPAKRNPADGLGFGGGAILPMPRLRPAGCARSHSAARAPVHVGSNRLLQTLFDTFECRTHAVVISFQILTSASIKSASSLRSALVRLAVWQCRVGIQACLSVIHWISFIKAD